MHALRRSLLSLVCKQRLAGQFLPRTNCIFLAAVYSQPSNDEPLQSPVGGRVIFEKLHKPGRQQYMHMLRKEECFICAKVVKHAENVAGHVLTAHGKNWYCDICSLDAYVLEYFNSEQSLTRHQDARHHGKRWHCVKCDTYFTRHDALLAHIKGFHGGWRRPRVLCTQCGISLSSNSALRRHERAEHEGLRYECQWCPRTSKYKDNLTRHIKDVHTCPICAKKVAHVATHVRDEHPNVHVPTCPACQQPVANLKRHMFDSHRQRHEKEACGSGITFTQRSSDEAFRMFVETRDEQCLTLADECSVDSEEEGSTKMAIKSGRKFVYLLMVTDLLPPDEVINETSFWSSVFYVGIGNEDRPYEHFRGALLYQDADGYACHPQEKIIHYCCKNARPVGIFRALCNIDKTIATAVEGLILNSQLKKSLANTCCTKTDPTALKELGIDDETDLLEELLRRFKKASVEGNIEIFETTDDYSRFF